MAGTVRCEGARPLSVSLSHRHSPRPQQDKALLLSAAAVCFRHLSADTTRVSSSKESAEFLKCDLQRRCGMRRPAAQSVFVSCLCTHRVEVTAQFLSRCRLPCSNNSQPLNSKNRNIRNFESFNLKSIRCFYSCCFIIFRYKNSQTHKISSRFLVYNCVRIN